MTVLLWSWRREQARKAKWHRVARYPVHAVLSCLTLNTGERFRLSPGGVSY